MKTRKLLVLAVALLFLTGTAVFIISHPKESSASSKLEQGSPPLAAPEAKTSAGDYPKLTMLEAEQLVIQYPEDFTVGPERPEDLEKWLSERSAIGQERMTRIVNTPGLKEEILIMLDKEHRQHGDGIASIVRALAARKDLVESDLVPIKAEIKRLLSVPKEAFDVDIMLYLSETVQLLEGFPSEENEELALGVLNLFLENGSSGVGIMWAAHALGGIGTERALPAMKIALEKEMPYITTVTEKDPRSSVNKLRKAIKRLEERISKDTSGK